jgi:hypothetical protein
MIYFLFLFLDLSENYFIAYFAYLWLQIVKTISSYTQLNSFYSFSYCTCFALTTQKIRVGLCLATIGKEIKRHLLHLHQKKSEGVRTNSTAVPQLPCFSVFFNRAVVWLCIILYFIYKCPNSNYLFIWHICGPLCDIKPILLLHPISLCYHH